jgi:hypothetical protein
MKRSLIVVAFTAMIVFLLPLAASGEDKKSTPATAADASIDLAVPDSPAFAVLGVSPSNVERPGSPRELALSLLNGVDANGNFQTGMAVETAPYLALWGSTSKLTDYQDDNQYRIRFLSRALLSFATAKGTSDSDKAVRLAVGLRFTPWDEGDPRLDKDLMNCLIESVEGIPISQQMEIDNIIKQFDRYSDEADGLPDNNPRKKELQGFMDALEKQRKELQAKGTAELNKKADAAIKACRANGKFRSNLWNKSSWSLGVAPTWTSTTAKTEDLKYSGMGAWTSVAFRLGESGQFIVHARYRNKEQEPDPNVKDVYFEQDSYRFGGRLRYGRPDLNFNAECLYSIENRPSGREDNRTFRYGIGAEYNIAKNVWINLNTGSQSGNEGGNNLFVLGNLNFAFSPEPTMTFK